MAARGGGMKAFEKSKFDVDPKGEREGSPADEARDRRQARSAGFINKGGKVKAVGKEVSSKPLPAVGSQPIQSARVGGLGNDVPPVDYSKRGR